MGITNKTNFLAMAVYVELQSSVCIGLKELADIIYIKYPNFFKEYQNIES